jgi:hypothetical protein
MEMALVSIRRSLYRRGVSFTSATTETRTTDYKRFANTRLASDWSQCSRDVLNAILTPAASLMCIVVNGVYRCGNLIAEILIENAMLRCDGMFHPT